MKVRWEGVGHWTDADNWNLESGVRRFLKPASECRTPWLIVSKHIKENQAPSWKGCMCRWQEGSWPVAFWGFLQR